MQVLLLATLVINLLPDYELRCSIVEYRKGNPPTKESSLECYKRDGQTTWTATTATITSTTTNPVFFMKKKNGIAQLIISSLNDEKDRHRYAKHKTSNSPSQEKI